MSSTQAERQNVFGKSCNEKSGSLDVSLVDNVSSADHEFAGLIDSEYLVDEEVKNSDAVYEMDMNQQDELLQENDSEYFLMGSVNEECSGSNEMLSNMHEHEESFYLNTEMGNISVTFNDLIQVGVNVNTNIISIDNDQTAALLKLVQNRDASNVSGYVSNFETVEPKDNERVVDADGQYEQGTSTPPRQLISNLYAYIEADGTVLLVEDKTEKHIAKFNREELIQFGIMDVNKITDAELQKLAQSVIDMEQPINDLPPTLLSYPIMNKKFKPNNHFMGERVEIISERFPTPVHAVIRYMRKNGETFKVQYDNGQFEWISSEQIIRHDNRRKSSVKKVKKSQPKESSVEKSLPKAHTHDNCALCDKQIKTKPAFIVIRLPACRECSHTKALMLEDKICNIKNNESLLNNSSLQKNSKK